MAERQYRKPPRVPPPRPARPAPADALPEAIRDALANDAAFRVLTMDGLGWIDPYTGQVLATPFGHEQEAVAYFTRQQPWTSLRPKPLGELLALRWLHYLRANLEFVEALRIFKDDCWLNPYTGEWETSVPLFEGRMVGDTVDAMARTLAACPEAQSGRMLEKFRIDQLVAKGPPRAQPATPTAPPVARPVGGQPPQRPVTTTIVRPGGAGLSRPVTASQPRPSKARTDFVNIKTQCLKMFAKPPRLDGYQIVVHCEPRAAIVRSFYDFLSLDRNRLLIAVGEFIGDGPGAALGAASTLRTMRRLAGSRPELTDFVAVLNDQVRLDLVPGCAVQLFAAVINIPFNTLTCLSMGSHPALLANPGRAVAVQTLHTDGHALGTSHGQAFRDTLRPISVQLQPGDLFLYASDGVAQGFDRNDVADGHRAVIGSAIANLGKPVPAMVAEVIAGAKDGWGARLPDDLLVTAVRVKG
jgi:hypothetical protein